MTIDRKLIAAAAVLLLVGAVLGAWAEYVLGPRQVVEKPVVTEKIVTKTDTQIQYVPKETVVYKDGAVTKEQTDVQADIGQPAVMVKVNGKDYKFDLLQSEQQKFQDGKVLLTQTSAIDLKIKVPVVEKNNVLGAEITNKDASVFYTHKALGITVGRTWDGEIRVGGKLVYRF